MSIEMTVYFKFIAILFNFKVFNCIDDYDSEHVIEPVAPVEIKGNFNATSHFQYPHIVQKYCNVTNWETICKSNDTRICAARPKRRNIKTVSDLLRDLERRDFNNSCYLFLNNMCQNPDNEYYIEADTDCESYLARRRSGQTVTTDTVATDVVAATDNTNTTTDDTQPSAYEETTPTYVDNDTVIPTDEYLGNATEEILADQIGSMGNSSALRSSTNVTWHESWPTYSVDYVFDFHNCPMTCPDDYKPECFIVNRAKGEYMKIFTFLNHCLGDLYYCQHPEEFKPPPSDKGKNADVDVKSSDISWSYCASFKYISFARFSEVLYSMGHYGWLAGDFRSQHILEPQARIPGYG